MICQARNIRQWTGAFEAYMWFGLGQSLSARFKHSKACVLVQAADSMTELFLEEKGFGGGEGTRRFVANYQQRVLTSFQQVEDNLASLRSELPKSP
jgi:hypothetical protein